MNAALFKQSIKSGWKILALFIAVVTMYVTIMVIMSDSEMKKVLDEYSKVIPDIMAAFGMNSSTTNLTEFLASYLYGFILLIFPMVYVIITANSLVVHHVDRGSMSYLLASPNKRTRITFTQAMTLIVGIFTIITFAALLAISLSEALFPGKIDITDYLILNLGLFCLHFFIGGLCFLASCICNDVKTATMIGGGISILCYLFQSIANVGDKFGFLKYATFFTLFDSDLLIKGSNEGYLMAGCLFVGGLILFIVGITAFNRRDLHV